MLIDCKRIVTMKTKEEGEALRQRWACLTDSVLVGSGARVLDIILLSVLNLLSQTLWWRWLPRTVLTISIFHLPNSSLS